MTLQEYTNELQNMCHSGYAQYSVDWALENGSSFILAKNTNKIILPLVDSRTTLPIQIIKVGDTRD